MEWLKGLCEKERYRREQEKGAGSGRRAMARKMGVGVEDESDRLGTCDLRVTETDHDEYGEAETGI